MTERIKLTGAQETLLGTLYARALDNRSDDPILGDETADRLLSRIDYDFRKLMPGSGDRMTVTLRAKQLDDWVTGYLAEHPDAVVLHLGCGLDSRAFRLDLPTGVQWYDVDQPDVIELRGRLYPRRENYQTIGTSVANRDWLDKIPADRPTLIVAEGLTPYLAEADGVALLQRLVERFPEGEMMFDAVLPWVLRFARYAPLLRTTGASFGWAIGDARELEQRVPGMHLIEERSPLDVPGVAKMSPLNRFTAHAMKSVKPLRNSVRLLRYRFRAPEKKREKINLTGAQATMLATLYLRALDNRSADPMLGDHYADEAVQRIDYDFTRFKMGSRNAGSVAIRAAALDRWVRDALRRHPEATVLHPGCGLDSRVFRIDPPETVEWYDIDHPDVIELRRHLHPERAHCHTIGSSVTNPHLLDDIPGSKPVLLVAEGLTMYLSKKDGVELLRRIVEHFPCGELLFDAFSSFGVRLSNRANPAVVQAGAHLDWGIDDPRTLEAAVPGLTLVTEWSFTDAPELDRYPWLARKALRASGRITAVRRLGRMLRYRF